jgi:hypothetical protein
VLLGDGGVAGAHGLAADVAGELLGRDAAVAVHQDDQWRAVGVLEDERLDDPVGVDAQRGSAAAIHGPK